MERKTPGPHKHRLVCLHWATQQARKRTQLQYILSLCVVCGDIFTSPFSPRPPTSFFVTTMTPGRKESVEGRGAPFHESHWSVCDTNKPICCNCPRPRPCVPLRRAASGGRGGEGKRPVSTPLAVLCACCAGMMLPFLRWPSDS